MSRNEDAKGPSLGKETMLVDRHDHRIDLSCQQAITPTKAAANLRSPSRL